MKLMCLICVCLIWLSGYADGDPFVSGVSVGVGQGRSGVDIYRLGVQKDFSADWLANRTGWLSGYCEASANYWKKNSDEVYGAAFSPVFVYFFGNHKMAINPYIEAGIGAACISGTRLGSRRLSTAFQFEDRLGMGVRMRRGDFCVRYMHYSNGSIAEPNDGIDSIIATVSYRL